MPIWFSLVETLRRIQEFIPKSSQMYQSVCGGHGACKSPNLQFLGMDLTKSAAHAGGMPGATPYYILVVLLVVTMFLQQRQMMRFQTQVNPQMQMMSRVMPAVFGALSFIYPAGVALYFLVSTVWQIGQQELVIRTMDNAPAPGKVKAVEAASVVEGDESKPKPAAGLKGMFGNLRAQPQLSNGGESQNGASGDEAAAEGGKATQSAKASGGSSSGAAKSGGASRGGSGSGAAKTGPKTGGAAKSGGAKSGGAKSGGGQRSGGGQSNRRRNNRKRKR
jgi:hypothetical protein